MIFDLDGVLTDTAESHFQSWMDVSREFGIPFDRAANDALRGLSREDSLRLFLGPHASRFSAAEQTQIITRKNDRYLARIERMSTADLAPGARELLQDLRAWHTAAVASSSRNAVPSAGAPGAFGRVLDAGVDGNDVPVSKPDPTVVLCAAERLGVQPQRCVVVEYAASGVAAGLAAGMRVVGLGPPQRVGRAHLVLDSLAELDARRILALLPSDD